MLDLLLSSLVFAQDPPAEPAAPASSPMGGLGQMLIIFVPVMFLFYFMMMRPNQRRERDRKKMLDALKKNDHVVTVGGIKGVVSNVKPEEDEVVLRIDDTTGAKLHVVLSSIARVIAADEDAAEAKKDS